MSVRLETVVMLLLYAGVLGSSAFIWLLGTLTTPELKWWTAGQCWMLTVIYILGWANKRRGF